jgi:cell division protein FtsI/penicillin-binding protein 2
LRHGIVPFDIKPETANVVLRPILKDIVAFGTGRYAKQEGYELGGKTGTAQMLRADGHGYADKSFFSSFLCLAPIDDPQIVVAVMMVKPRVDAHKTYYGGRASAPVAGRIARRTLLHMGVKPHYDVEAVHAAAPPLHSVAGATGNRERRS